MARVKRSFWTGKPIDPPTKRRKHSEDCKKCSGRTHYGRCTCRRQCGSPYCRHVERQTRPHCPKCDYSYRKICNCRGQCGSPYCMG